MLDGHGQVLIIPIQKDTNVGDIISAHAIAGSL